VDDARSTPFTALQMRDYLVVATAAVMIRAPGLRTAGLPRAGGAAAETTVA
jgi:hypothetical protein